MREKFKKGEIVSATRTFNGEIITGEFQGYHLFNDEIPDTVVGIVHVPGDGVYDVDVTSIRHHESEDERIRKKTINCLVMHNKGCVDAKDIDECIAWLEKQKELPTNEEMLRTLRAEYEKGVADTIAKYEQKEQKPNIVPKTIRPKFAVGDTVCRPMWSDHTIREIYIHCDDPVYVCVNDEGTESHISFSEQDEWKRKEKKSAEWSEDKFPKDIEADAVQFCFDNGINITPYQAKQIATHYLMVGHNEGYLEGRKNAHIPARELGLPSSCDFQKEQKPAEKQDYSGLNDLERAILRGFLCAGVENVPVTIIKETAQECLAHMPAEWSEEDERIREALYKHFSVLYPGDSKFRDTKLSNRQITDFLKSLRPSWKPSEEQIAELKALANGKAVFTKDFIVKLYNGLLKLKSL